MHEDAKGVSPPGETPLADEAASWERLDIHGVPSLGRSYLRALAGGLTKRAAPPRALSITAPPRPVDLAHLARYRRVTGFADPRVLPPTYPHVLAVPLHLALLTHPAFPARALGLVHTEQRIDVLAPLPPGQPLELTASVGAGNPARRGSTFEVETTATADGEVVWRGRTTVLAPGHKPSRPVSQGSGSSPQPSPRPTPGDSVASPGEDAEGVVSLLWPLSAGLGRRYARVGGDYNPIHLSAVTARLFGFKRAIVHGMWAMARALAAVEDLPPAAPARYDVSFRRPIFLPSEVRFHAAQTEEGLALRLTSARTGKLHLEGTVVPL